MSFFLLTTPWGDLQGVTSQEKITHLQWHTQEDIPLVSDAITHPAQTAHTSSHPNAQTYLTTWVKAYIEGKTQPFDTSYLAMDDISPSMGKLYAFLMDIPYGQTTDYGTVAKHIHSSPRAVGQMLRRNRFALIIPCHRITGQKGYLRGYGGKSGIERQRQLISCEKKRISTRHMP